MYSLFRSEVLGLVLAGCWALPARWQAPLVVVNWFSTSQAQTLSAPHHCAQCNCLLTSMSSFLPHEFPALWEPSQDDLWGFEEKPKDAGIGLIPDTYKWCMCMPTSVNLEGKIPSSWPDWAGFGIGWRECMYVRRNETPLTRLHSRITIFLYHSVVVPLVSLH